MVVALRYCYSMFCPSFCSRFFGRVSWRNCRRHIRPNYFKSFPRYKKDCASSSVQHLFSSNDALTLFFFFFFLPLIQVHCRLQQKAIVEFRSQEALSNKPPRVHARDCQTQPFTSTQSRRLLCWRAPQQLCLKRSCLLRDHNKRRSPPTIRVVSCLRTPISGRRQLTVKE